MNDQRMIKEPVPRTVVPNGFKPRGFWPDRRVPDTDAKECGFPSMVHTSDFLPALPFIQGLSESFSFPSEWGAW